jgi:ABC-type nickel/cobalt efflux system permease component RcnA
MHGTGDNNEWHPSQASWAMVVVSWVLVGIPLAWGIWKTLQKAAVLFK